MTKSEAYFYRLAMPRPFAKGSGGTITAIESASGNNVNFLDGFPSAYSAPHSGGGKYITRGEMNAIGNLASQNQFYFLAGGINTFDEEFCNAIGGYPQGAVLDANQLGVIRKVISLKDNNKVNFNGSSTIEGITDGYVDGVNWQYADTGAYVKREPQIIDTFSNYVIYAADDEINKFLIGNIFLIGTYTAPTSGAVSIKNEKLIFSSTTISTNPLYSPALSCGIFHGSLCSLVKVFSPGAAIDAPEITKSGTNFTLTLNGYKNIGLGASKMDFIGGHKDANSNTISVASETAIPPSPVFASAGDIIVIYGVIGAGSLTINSSNQLTGATMVESITASFELCVL